MKRLILTAALAWGGAALAQSGAAPRDELRTEELKQEAKKGWESVKKEAKKLPGQVEQTTRDAARGLGLTKEDQPGTFREEKAFKLSGTVKSAGKTRVTVQREGLPAASLDIHDATKLTLNGQPITGDQLPEGALVRAKFQLQGTDTVAVSIDANVAPPKGARATPKR